MNHTPTSLRTFAQNLMAYGASEIASKGSRLLVVVAVSRTMDIAQIGVAAAALASGDILKSMTENGVVQRIIAAPESDLEASCNTAKFIFWNWCGGLFLLQCAIASVLVLAGNPMLGALLAILSLEYLFMPAGLVQVALAMREGKLKQTAAIAGAQIVGANVLTILLAVVWPSALVLVLPRILAAPIWLIAVRRLRPWSSNAKLGRSPLKPFITFGWLVLSVELVKALRIQGDKLVVGFMMGAEMLGLYFMAFNAGLSLATSFSQTFSVVLFPHLCTTSNKVETLRQGFVLAVGVITPVVIIQALLAPVYVPVLLGDNFASLGSTVAILCLAAIPTILWSVSAGWLRSCNRPDIELVVTIVLAVSLMANITLFAPFGLAAIAKGYLAVCTVIMAGASIPIVLEAFNLKPQRT